MDGAPQETAGHIKATRDDWLEAAMEVLITGGVSEVKILKLSQKLGVSRSSFYWYFESRKDLLSQLLREWERSNTGIMVAHAALPAKTITAALNNFFRCVVDPKGFDHRLDFAIREWARRDATVRAEVDKGDAARHKAIAEMFRRHGYPEAEADIRARVLYYQQIGYYALELGESLEDRLARAPGYVFAFSGVMPSEEEVAEFEAFARRSSRL